jgi:hypothetical protein
MEKEALLPIHKILCRKAYDQMMFAFVRGCLACDEKISVPDALRKFAAAFQIEEFSVKSATVLYYRMLHEFMPKNSIFNEKQLQAHGRPSRVSQRYDGANGRTKGNGGLVTD